MIRAESQDEVKHEEYKNSGVLKGKSHEEYQIKIPQSSNVPNLSTCSAEAKENNGPSKHVHSVVESGKTDDAIDHPRPGAELSDKCQTEKENDSNVWPLDTENTLRSSQGVTRSSADNITSSSLTLQENLDCFDSSEECPACDTLGEGGECEVGSSRQQKLNEEQRNIYEAEPVNCVNSSEDEEIKKELTSILPNGPEKMQKLNENRLQNQ